ncbi:hypothetical protein FA13DRAFT_1728536 [Coprinellus micaceus]|uniref:Bromo domain-containing protein n=1 Tax=Coprinellus micaceus TaxID=71717 RepID=A0A4Y7TP26_COPMI|nr:hypothetical protein FA13DRAFT_1728536 [Coprinellus micaceus]
MTSSAPENLALAQKYFQIRFEELVDLIKAEETKFRTVVKEIEEIKAGHWDSSLKARLSGTPASAIERGTTEDAPETTEDDADADATSEPEEDVEETGEPEEEDAMDEDASQSAEEEAKSEAEDEADAGTEDLEEPLEDNSEVNESVPEAEETSKEAEGEAEEQSESSEDEPLQVVRRSTRRKSSAASTAPPVPPRGRRRQRAVKEEQESAAGSDAEAEAEASEDAGGGEEEAPSSPGAPRTRDGKRKAVFSDDARDSKRAREDSELPEEEGEPTTTTRASGRKGGQKVVGPSSSASTAAGPAPAPPSTTATEGLPNKKFQNVIGLLHQQISTHRNGTIFHHPIKTSDAPDYYDITVKQRVKDGAISNSLEFQRDVYLMFANAMMYNRPGSDVYTMAEDMMHDSELAIKNHKQTEGF